MKTYLIAILSNLILVTIAFSQTVNVDELINKAKTLIDQKKYQESYQSLSKAEFEYGGQPLFDFYLGLSALEAGKPTEAVFALERAIEKNPDFYQARADLGRAYFAMGENQAAEKEFTLVKEDSKTPTLVKSKLDIYLAELNRRSNAGSKKLRKYINFSVGNDSNINAATDESQVILPGISTTLLATLPASSQETESSYVRVNPGLSYSTKMNENTNFFAGADLNLLKANDADQFSTNVTNLNAGIVKLAGTSQFHTLVSFQKYKLDGDDYRDTTGLSAQWIKSFNKKSKLTSYIKLSNASYENGLKDGSINVVGANWLKASKKHIAHLGFGIGAESVDDSNQQAQAKDFVSVKTGVRYYFGKNNLFANLTLQQNSFKAIDPVQLAKRDGLFTALNIGYDMKLTPALKFTPKLSINKNSTKNDLVLYDYDRSVLDFNLKYTF